MIRFLKPSLAQNMFWQYREVIIFIYSPGGVNVKKIFYAVALVLVWSVAAQAAVVYLKGGGQIKAQKVWRKKGAVVVLVNRDSITTFANSELNLKKTFPPRK